MTKPLVHCPELLSKEGAEVLCRQLREHWKGRAEFVIVRSGRVDNGHGSRPTSTACVAHWGFISERNHTNRMTKIRLKVFSGAIIGGIIAYFLFPTFGWWVMLLAVAEGILIGLL
jgi:hypothetical protein